MLDEEEKNAALSDKKNRAEVQSVSEAENQKDRMGEIAMVGFFEHSKLTKYSETIWAFRKINSFPKHYASPLTLLSVTRLFL
jgi:hypothetical protein